MTRVVLFLAFALLGFSLSKAAVSGNDKKVDDKWKEMKPEDRDALNTLVINSMMECNETFRIEMAYVMSMNNSGSFPDETDRTPKCYVRCILEKMGIATEDGEYDPERTAMVLMSKRSGMDDAVEIVMSCKDRKETCKCEKAYQYVKCIKEAEIKRYETS